MKKQRNSTVIGLRIQPEIMNIINQLKFDDESNQDVIKHCIIAQSFSRCKTEKEAKELLLKLLPVWATDLQHDALRSHPKYGPIVEAFEKWTKS